MDKKLTKILEPGFRLFFAVILLFAFVSAFVSVYLAVFELAVCGVLYIYYKISTRNRRREMLHYLEYLTQNVDTAARDSVTHFPMPVTVAMVGTGRIVWCNDLFNQVYDLSDQLFEQHLSDIVPGFDSSWLLENQPIYPSEVLVGERYYQIYGRLVPPKEGETSGLMTLYWLDCTERTRLRARLAGSRPVVSIISIDNYEELVKNVTDSEKATLLAAIDNRIGDWAKEINGLLRKYDRDRYIFVMEQDNLEQLTQGKFYVLDSVRQIISNEGINATLSIGVGRDGEHLKESFEFASLALEMALSRGGDQVVIKNRFAFEFFGGVSKEVEKRTKVKSRVMANALGQLMRDSSQVFIMGHGHSDMDAVGAAVGVVRAAKSRDKQAYIVLRRSRTLALPLLEKLEASGEYEGVFIEPDEASNLIDGNSLLVVVDTNRPNFVEEPALLSRFSRIAVIDHHRRAAEYIEHCSVNMHEPSASSASELVTELLQYMVPNRTISRLEAESLLAGIYLDTKGFYIKAGVRTFEAAAYLKRAGADMAEVKRMFQNSFDEYMQRERIIACTQSEEGGMLVAVTDFETERPIAAQAADELLNIIGVTASIVAFPRGKSYIVSLRSMGAVNVQVIAEKLGGGGSLTAAGAQLGELTEEEVRTRIHEAIAGYLEQMSKQEEV